MDIGTGIAIAGAWLFSGMIGLSPSTSGFAFLISIACAVIVTGVLI